MNPSMSITTPFGRRLAWVLIYVCCAVLILGLVFVMVSIRFTQDRIRDCTTPGGECYERGQSQTADAVGNINRVIVLAAACAVGVDPDLPVAERQTRIQSCVIDRLAAKP